MDVEPQTLNLTGKYLILAGIILVLAGLVLWLAGNKLGWPGNLPGDLKIEKGNVKIYIPFTTMILTSIILSAILWLLKKAGMS